MNIGPPDTDGEPAPRGWGAPAPVVDFTLRLPPRTNLAAHLRQGTIEEAGKLCLFLAAEATSTTGVDHILSGGAELAYGRKSRVS